MNLMRRAVQLHTHELGPGLRYSGEVAGFAMPLGRVHHCLFVANAKRDADHTFPLRVAAADGAPNFAAHLPPRITTSTSRFDIAAVGPYQSFAASIINATHVAGEAIKPHPLHSHDPNGITKSGDPLQHGHHALGSLTCRPPRSRGRCRVAGRTQSLSAPCERFDRTRAAQYRPTPFAIPK